MRRRRWACIALLLFAAACTEAPATEPVARGRQVYRALDCGRCHQIAGDGARIGPELTHVGAIAAERRPGASAEDYLRESIVSPGSYVVPGFTDTMPRGLTLHLSEADLEALLAYLGSLR